MKSSISEDDIEQAILQMLESPEFGYEVVRCNPSPEKMDVLPDGTGRSSKKQCVLPGILRESLTRLNPEIPANKLDEIAQDLVRDYSGTDMVATNYALYKKIRDGVRVPTASRILAMFRLSILPTPRTTRLLPFRRCGFRGTIIFVAPMFWCLSTDCR